MKKIKYLLLLLLLTPTINVKAASGIVDIYTSNKKPLVGSSITVTVYCKTSGAQIGGCEYSLSYNQNVLKLTSGDVYNVEAYQSSDTTITKTFTFKVIGSGSSNISVTGYQIQDRDTKKLSTSVSPTSITAKTQSEIEASYSSNNNLSSLSVSNATLSPAFNKNTLNYKTEVNSSVEKITISATPEDSASRISGTGEKELSEGTNKFEIVVTSQKGTTKKYTITIEVKDDNPINVKIDDQNYTVIKRKSSLKKIDNFTEATAIINNIEVPALYNDITKFTLVGLKNNAGEVNLYIYDKTNNSYKLYNEIKTNSLTIIPILTYKTLDLKKGKVTINNISYDAYKFENAVSYSVIYCINLATGEEGWYMYEKTENTFQKYNPAIVKNYITKVNSSNEIIYILSASTILFALLLIITNISNKKKLNKAKYKKEEINILDEKTKEIPIVKVEEKKQEKEKEKAKEELESTDEVISKIDFDKTSTNIETNKKVLKKYKKVLNKDKKNKSKNTNNSKDNISKRENEKLLDEW